VGNSVAVALAFLALGALRWGGRGGGGGAAVSGWALAVVWLFNVEGTADFLYSYAAGLLLNLAADYQLGPAWFIPTYFAPAALVIHAVIFVLLLRPLRRKPALSTAEGGAHLDT
jgi:hypothetical protein